MHAGTGHDGPVTDIWACCGSLLLIKTYLVSLTGFSNLFSEPCHIYIKPLFWPLLHITDSQYYCNLFLNTCVGRLVSSQVHELVAAST